jgi:glycosyltransferase involved in cell wall biosynthesis
VSQPIQRVGLSVVIPIFNERDNLAELDRELREVLGGLDLASEIIYVDDASSDGSSGLLDELVAAVPKGSIPTRAIHFRRNFGQTPAMAAGFDAARGSVVIPMDGDLQNDPHDIPRLLAKLDEGYDVVSGWRRNRKDKAITRKLPSKVANWLIGRSTGVELHDYGCTLKAYRAELLDDLRMYGEMHRFIPVYLAQLGARVTELEVNHRPRVAGKSKYGSRRILKVFLDLFLVTFVSKYYTRPMHFFGQAAIFFMMLFVLSGALMVVFKYGWLRHLGIDYQASFVQTPLPGLAGTFLLGAIASIFIGVLAEVLIRVQFETRNLRPYSIRSTTTSTESADD